MQTVQDTIDTSSEGQSDQNQSDPVSQSEFLLANFRQVIDNIDSYHAHIVLQGWR